MMATSLCRLPRPPLQTVLFFYGSGRTTDIVTDSGDSLSHTAPIHGGCALHHAILRWADRDPTEYLMKILTERGYPFIATAEREIVWVVTEKQCHISLDHDTELKSTAEIDQDKTDVFPDENIVTVAPNVSVSRKCCSSHTVPICESCALHHAIVRVAGRDLTEYFMKNLTEQGYSFSAAAKREIARDVKKKLFHIGVDYDTKLKSTAETDKERTYVFPDENIIAVGAERFRCVKVSFQPSFTSKEANGFHDTSFMKCDVDIRKELHASVVFSDGTTMFKRIFEHMTKELTALAPSTTKIKDNLPDGNIIIDGAESFRSVKVLVQSSSTGKEASGFHDTSFHNIMKCDVDIRLSRGTTNFPRDCGAHDEGTDSVGSIRAKIHGGCSTRVKVLGTDWRVHCVFPQYTPASIFFFAGEVLSRRQRVCCSAFAS